MHMWPYTPEYYIHSDVHEHILLSTTYVVMYMWPYTSVLTVYDLFLIVSLWFTIIDFLHHFSYKYVLSTGSRELVPYVNSFFTTISCCLNYAWLLELSRIMLLFTESSQFHRFENSIGHDLTITINEETFLHDFLVDLNRSL